MENFRFIKKTFWANFNCLFEYVVKLPCMYIYKNHAYIMCIKTFQKWINKKYIVFLFRFTLFLHYACDVSANFILLFWFHFCLSKSDNVMFWSEKALIRAFINSIIFTFKFQFDCAYCINKINDHTGCRLMTNRNPDYASVYDRGMCIFSLLFWISLFTFHLYQTRVIENIIL